METDQRGAIVQKSKSDETDTSGTLKEIIGPLPHWTIPPLGPHSLWLRKMVITQTLMQCQKNINKDE